jgi:hypothetical protein
LEIPFDLVQLPRMTRRRSLVSGGPAYKARLESRRQEMETAKEILAEIFGAQPFHVEEIIWLRLEERSWGEEWCGIRDGNQTDRS